MKNMRLPILCDELGRDEDPGPVGFVEFWPAGSRLFSTDPDLAGRKEPLTTDI